MKIIVRIALFAAIPLLCLCMVLAQLILAKNKYYNNINRSIETAVSSATGPSEPDPRLMSHRMIASDIQNGLISPQNAAKAFSNTAGYFNEVKNKCVKESARQTESIIACANKILGDHFYYYPARETAVAWAGHYSDCDSNVYILIDALQLFNKTASIVYAPGHAFLSWTDEQTGLPVWWETTSDANHGSPADLSRDDLYRKTMAPFYYRPQSGHYAEQFYTSVVTLNSLPAESRQERLEQAIRRYPENSFVDDLRYSQKRALTAADISMLNTQLQTDVSSVTKKYLLANYYMNKANEKLAKFYISKIDIDNCDAECRPLMIMAHPFSRIWFMASDIFSESVIKNEHGKFDVSKRIFSTSVIKNAIYEDHELAILMLFSLGVLLLYIGIVLGRTVKKSENQ